MCRAWPASTWRNACLASDPLTPRWLLISWQWSSSLLTRVVNQPLAHELLDRGGTAAAAALAPPGAEQLADHELRVERAAYSQQLARRAEQFGEQRVGRRCASPLAAL